MAFVVLKSTFARGSCMSNLLGKQASGLLCGSSKHVVSPIQVATLKATYDEKYPYKKPWPYETRRFTLLDEIYDRSLARINENSKVIIVEGNIGVGKTEFAKRLAADFDMKFIPCTSDNECFQFNNFDLRSLNEVLPEGAKFYDMANLLTDQDPQSQQSRRNIGLLQIKMFEARYWNYVDALRHLFNTGQGVVMVRSVYSDVVFAEALRKVGLMTPSMLKSYYELRSNSLYELLLPHVHIYLHAPVEALQERIKAEGSPQEANSKNLTKEYLQAIDNAYKTKVFPKIKYTGEFLEIDWTKIGDNSDMEIIAEELQTLNLEPVDNEDTRFHDWYKMTDDMVAWNRRLFDNKRYLSSLLEFSSLIDCPEMHLSTDDGLALEHAYRSHPMSQYASGWNPKFGHNVAFKLY